MVGHGSIKYLFILVKNEIKKIYGGSILGVLWFFLNPLLYTFVYYFLFEHIIQIKFRFNVEGVSYFQYLIVGLVIWNSLTTCILRGTASIVENAYILKKVAVQPEYFVLVNIVVYYLQGISFLFLLALFLKVFNPLQIFTFILSAVSLFLFILGVSMLLSSLTVYVRDIMHFLNNVFNFLFYSVPIIYPYEYVPASLKALVDHNPLFYIFRPFYDIILFKIVNVEHIISSYLVSLTSLIVGMVVFKKLKEGFYDVI